MNIEEIAAISGKPGLFRVIQKTRTGLILESLKDNSKMVTGPHHRVSLLSDISIFTKDVNKTIPLIEIFNKMELKFGNRLNIDLSSSAEELKMFLKNLVPDCDFDRTYPSDIKKIISWYKILIQYNPELLKEEHERKKYQTVDDESINLYFLENKFSNEDIAEVIYHLSEIYASIGGDQLEITGAKNNTLTKQLLPI